MDRYLQHYGILGMKWGVRRYENKDGTLTEAGKKRYNKHFDRIREDYEKYRHHQTKKEFKEYYDKSMEHGKAIVDMWLETHNAMTYEDLLELNRDAFIDNGNLELTFTSLGKRYKDYVVTEIDNDPYPPSFVITRR